MKKIVEQVEGEGLEKFLGEKITLFCANYIYTGKLCGVNETCILLTDPYLVYETGAFNESGWKDAQHLPGDEWYIQISAIESFGKTKWIINTIHSRYKRWSGSWSRSGGGDGSWSWSRSGDGSWSWSRSGGGGGSY